MQLWDENKISRVIDEIASNEEAKLVAEWFSTNDGLQCLSDLIDRQIELIETNPDPHSSISVLQSKFLYERIMKKIR